jgi:predicted nucleic acid-binding protein
MRAYSPKRAGAMLAIDTNIVVRYLTADHPEQSPKAKALIDSQDVFVCTTVLLETEWVLRSVYGLAPADIVKALAAFAGLPRVTLEDAALAATALSWTLLGMDFADALHLAKARGCDGFASFDLRLAKAAKQVSGLDVHTP